MKVIRYEFAGDGIFNALDYLYSSDMDIEDARDFSKIENIFEDKLPTPPYVNYDLSKGGLKFYFTLYGEKRFKKEISDLLNLFDIYCSTFGNTSKISKTIDDKSSNILYRDRFQIILQE